MGRPRRVEPSLLLLTVRPWRIEPSVLLTPHGPALEIRTVRPTPHGAALESRTVCSTSYSAALESSGAGSTPHGASKVTRSSACHHMGVTSYEKIAEDGCTGGAYTSSGIWAAWKPHESACRSGASAGWYPDESARSCATGLVPRIICGFPF